MGVKVEEDSILWLNERFHQIGLIINVDQLEQVMVWDIEIENLPSERGHFAEIIQYKYIEAIFYKHGHSKNEMKCIIDKSKEKNLRK